MVAVGLAIVDVVGQFVLATVDSTQFVAAAVFVGAVILCLLLWLLLWMGREVRTWDV